MKHIPSEIKDFLVISRAKIQIGTPPHPLLGLILGSSSVMALFSVPAVLYLALYFLLITFACNINCLFDINIDQKYKSYMSKSLLNLGKTKVKAIILTESVLIFGLISILMMMGYILTSILALSGFLMGYIYSANPIRIKKRGFLSPLPVLIGLYTLPLLGGWFIFNNSLSWYILIFTIGYALLNEGITLVNTCEDYSEDKSEGIKTWAHLFELRGTMKIALLFTLIGGLTAVVGVILKPIILGWSSYNLYSTIFFILAGIINVLIIIKTGISIYVAGERPNIEKSCKKAAKNMPKWFVSTRYPLLIMALITMLG